MDEQRLHDFFKFDESDMAANREDRFSENQIKILTEADRVFKKGMRRHGIPFVVVALLGPVSAYFGGKFLGLIWILVWGVLWTVIWGIIGWGFIEGSLKKPEFKLVNAKGPIKISLLEGYGPKHSKPVWNDLRIGRRHFEIHADLTNVIDPGDEYIIYFENDFKQIVAMELISAAQAPVMKTEKSAPTDSTAEMKKLMKHFKFDETDLMANQSGTLSEKQKQRIIKQAGGSRKWVTVIGIMLLLVAAVGLIPLFGTSSWVFKIGFGVIWTLVWGTLGTLLVALGIASTPQVTLLSLCGRANLVKGVASSDNHYRSSVYYDLHLNGHEFDGDKDFINLFAQDAEYVVYYTKGAEEIVAAEFVSAPN